MGGLRGEVVDFCVPFSPCFLLSPSPAPWLFYWLFKIKKNIITLEMYSLSSGEARAQSIEDRLKAVILHSTHSELLAS